MGIETLAAVSIGAAVLGTGVSMYGQGKAADAQAQAANYQAAVARNNQIIAERYAERSVQKGNILSETQDYKTRATLGAARAGYGAQGVDVNSGSPLAVRESIAEIGAMDAATIRNNAAEEAFGYKVKAAGFGADSQLGKMKAAAAEEAGQYAQASTLLGGVSSVSDKWIGYQTKGIF